MKKIKSFLAIFILCCSSQVVQAVEFKKIPADGIRPEIWYMYSQAVPSVSMQVSFPIGYAHDPKNKEGLAHFVASTMDEGAGSLDSIAFREQLADYQIALSYSVTPTRFNLILDFLKYDAQKALELAKLSLSQPRFDTSSIELIRSQILASIQQMRKAPGSLVSNVARKIYYNSHSFSKPETGYLTTVKQLTRDDLKKFHRKLTAKNVFVSVVGDIKQEQTEAFIEKLVAVLPQEENSIDEISKYTPIDIEKNISVYLDIPQSKILMMTSSFTRDDPDFMTAYVVSHILGGGGFGSELVTDLREKNGLTYSITASLDSSAYDGRLLIDYSTDNKNVVQSIDKVKAVLRKMLEKGITQEQLDKAITNIKGQYALAFETNHDISALAQGLHANHLAHTYPQDRQKLFSTILLADVNRVIKKMLNRPLTIIIVGGNKTIKNFDRLKDDQIKF